MKTNLKQLKEIVFEAVNKAGFNVNPDDVRIEKAKTLEHGHFATNVALLIAGKFGRRPYDVAELLATELRKNDFFTKIDIAGPGFVNMWIEQKFYSAILEQILSDFDDYLKEEIDVKKGKKMVIEYSSPNIAKPLGAHHLLSTIIGDSLSRICRKYGYEVISENYPGDIGTQFGKLIYAIDTWGDEKEIEKNPIDELLKLYVRFHDEAEKDPGLEQFGRDEYKKFEDGDKKVHKMWKKIVDWSFKEIQPLYDRLNVKYDAVHGESFFEERMKDILKKGRESGIFVDGENGAWVAMSEDPNDPPALVKKSDGTTLYLTRDLAQIDFFEEEYHPDVMVWVVDVAQSLHFKQRFQVAKKMNLTSSELRHVEFGRMLGMSTRKGNVVKLKEVLDESEERCLQLIDEKGAELSAKERKELSVIMGVGAVKYNILHQNRISNITFNWDQMLSLEGNSAPYLMYTVARAKSILRKAGLKQSGAKEFTLELSDNAETRVVLDILAYPEALEKAAMEFKPNHIANFLYQLAQDFNTFYNALPVIQAEKRLMQSRLLITGAVITAMEDAFKLLGLEVPEKM